MKNHTIIIFSLLFICLIFYKFKPEKQYKVLRIVTTDKIFVDFNNNEKEDKNELVKIYGIKPFKPKFDRENTIKSNSLGVQKAQIAVLGAKADDYAKRLLQNKFITLQFINDETNNINHFSTASVYLHGKDYGKTLIEQGFALADFKNDLGYKNNENITAIDRNIKNINTDDYFLLNKKNNKYHKLDCKYAQKAKENEVISHDKIPKNAQKCGYCFGGQNYKITKYQEEKFVMRNFDFTLGNISYFFTDFNKTQSPSQNCSTGGCKALLQNIEKAQTSIDFAVYGFSDEPKIVEALTKAQKRGVKIRWVTDSDFNGNNIYKDVNRVKELLCDWVDDKKDINAKNINSIMHNKFFIFDKKAVWLGSANISNTDLADFNANTILLIKSAAVAQIYENEFEQMYRGKFHKSKINVNDKTKIDIDSNTGAKIRFSPYDKIIECEIIPLVENAKKYIYISTFVITHKNLKPALMRAKRRGVDVRVITDATGAGDKYSATKVLRQNGILVKVENKAGKMHSKTIIIDDKYAIVGSMNFSRSGEDFNDENVIIIENPFVTKRFKEQFLYLYQSIPERWLYKNPRAEGWDSLGSCEDCIDNDFDGLIDRADRGCKAKVDKK